MLAELKAKKNRKLKKACPKLASPPSPPSPNDAYKQTIRENGPFALAQAGARKAAENVALDAQAYQHVISEKGMAQPSPSAGSPRIPKRVAEERAKDKGKRGPQPNPNPKPNWMKAKEDAVVVLEFQSRAHLRSNVTD